MICTNLDVSDDKGSTLVLISYLMLLKVIRALILDVFGFIFVQNEEGSPTSFMLCPTVQAQCVLVFLHNW